jgi:4-hydroxybenzoate polyprenyltransferase
MIRKKISNYLSLVKFSHTLFAMPFAIIGFFLAIKLNNIELQWKLLVLVVLCMVFARNAAMAFNRYADREIDLKNPRTAFREIPRGIIKAKSALMFTILNCFLFLLTTLFINTLVFYLSFVALAVVLGYSLTKKFTSICHFILGLGLSLAPIGSYLAVTGKFALMPVLFSFIVLTWVSGFDIIYALQDEEFDKEEKLLSIPAILGRKRALYLSVFLHFITAIIVVIAGIIADFGTFYWLGSIVFIGLLTYQHLIISPSNISRLNMAFFTLNGIASVLFAVFTSLELLL